MNFRIGGIESLFQKRLCLFTQFDELFLRRFALRVSGPAKFGD